MEVGFETQRSVRAKYAQVSVRAGSEVGGRSESSFSICITSVLH